MGPAGVGCTMPDYRIFFLEGRHIKEPAKKFHAPTTKRRQKKRENCC
jgi:hypothetical protein